MSRLLTTARDVLTDPLALAELFLLANISFLAVDVAIAHSTDAFEQRAEWVPVVFSLLAAAALLAAAILAGSVRPRLPPWANHSDGVLGARRWIAWGLGMIVGFLAVGVGLAGLIFHLQSGFFQQQTLRNLVYAAPFAAPLSYAGLGLLAILNRTVPSRTIEWARWMIFLALGGFLGNFVLSLTDHAQNGFFDAREWVAVIAAAFAVGGLLAALVDYGNRAYLWLCQCLMLVEIVVGFLGWYYHIRAILRSPMNTLWDKILYSAPVFAPLLFANLAILGMLGLWGLLRLGVTGRPENLGDEEK
ncbi:MAG: hypothetical protein ACLQNE_25355 [Thermoguttaceae bacterium]